MIITDEDALKLQANCARGRKQGTKSPQEATQTVKQGKDALKTPEGLKIALKPICPLEQVFSILGVSVKREYKFMETRRFRFDYAMPEIKLAIEYEGVFCNGQAKGGHSSITGILRDVEKYNEATILGWRIIRITANMINDNRALDYIQRAMGGLK